MEYKWLAQNGLLFLMPVIAAVIGWLTNFIAVKMLTRPIYPRKIFGLTFQGLLPKRHKELASRIAAAIAKDFLTEEHILELIRQANTDVILKDYIKQKWDEKIDDILSFAPMIQMFLPPERLAEIRDKIAEAFSGNSKEFIHILAEGLQGKIDLEETIRKNILDFDLNRLEAIIQEIARREFRYIERLGGVIGFVIGLVQAVLVYFLF